MGSMEEDYNSSEEIDDVSEFWWLANCDEKLRKFLEFKELPSFQWENFVIETSVEFSWIIRLS